MGAISGTEPPAHGPLRDDARTADHDGGKRRTIQFRHVVGRNRGARLRHERVGAMDRLSALAQKRHRRGGGGARNVEERDPVGKETRRSLREVGLYRAGRERIGRGAGHARRGTAFTGGVERGHPEDIALPGLQPIHRERSDRPRKKGASRRGAASLGPEVDPVAIDRPGAGIPGHGNKAGECNCRHQHEARQKCQPDYPSRSGRGPIPPRGSTGMQRTLLQVRNCEGADRPAVRRGRAQPYRTPEQESDQKMTVWPKRAVLRSRLMPAITKLFNARALRLSFLLCLAKNTRSSQSRGWP